MTNTGKDPWASVDKSKISRSPGLPAKNKTALPYIQNSSNDDGRQSNTNDPATVIIFGIEGG